MTRLRHGIGSHAGPVPLSAAPSSDEPQALATARRLRNLCMASYGVLYKELSAPSDNITAALTTLTGPLRPLPGETPELSQRRQDALETIQRQCSALVRDPQAMDRHEIRFVPKASKSGFAAALQMHLNAQDFHSAGMTILTGARSTPIAFFEGMPWGGTTPTTFALALHFAMGMDPRPEGRLAVTLDQAVRCLQDGHCTEEEIALHAVGEDAQASPETLARARALAPRLFAAMQAGRVEPFLAPWDSHP